MNLPRRGSWPFILLFLCLAVPRVAAAGGSAFDADVPPFHFRSGFWTNLHHFLYQEALRASRPGGPGEGGLPAEKLTAEEQRAWSAALEHYRQNLIRRDLLFDSELVAIDTALTAAAGQASLRGDQQGVPRQATGGAAAAAVPSELTAVLESAATIYRAHWWAAHDRANRFWIAAATPLVEQLGAKMVEQMTAAYQDTWPAKPVLVDVAVYANWAGAYTTGHDPVHTILSSTNSSYQGYAALEMLFHEASHGVADRQSPIYIALEREYRSRGRSLPYDLIHTIIFYTAGELARRNLAGVGVSDYVPCAERIGVYLRLGQSYKDAVELFWQRRLDGKLDIGGAAARLAAALE
jgi:hypothetical protein